MSESAEITEFVERARQVTIAEAAARLGLKFRQRGNEHPQPCRVTGGKDRFSFNTSTNLWNCRGCGTGGRDGIGLAAHEHELNLKRRDGFLEACALVLGEEIPAGGERESAADRTARLARIAARQTEAAVAAERQAAGQRDFREQERRRARGIVDHAARLGAGPSIARSYIARRTGAAAPTGWLRASAEQTYWHGQAALHVGPAMILPFIDRSLAVIGCHITWIDLARGPKFRPLLTDPDTGEVLPTKKMRGSKKGGLLPLAGDFSARRWVGGEGVENGLAFAGWEDFRSDTFYFAAGDLGNLAGPADPASRFAHPTLTRLDKNGRERPVMVVGDEPKPGQGPDEAMWVGDHVDELVLLGDGDSEPVATAAAMARAKKRLGREGRQVFIIWPKARQDFSGMAAAGQ